MRIDNGKRVVCVVFRQVAFKASDDMGKVAVHNADDEHENDGKYNRKNKSSYKMGEN